MKKNSYTNSFKGKAFSALFGLLILVGFSGCKGFLRVEPSNVLAMSNYEDVRSVLGAHLRGISLGIGPRYALYPTTTFFYPNTSPYYQLSLHFYSDDMDPIPYLDHWMGVNNRVQFYNSLNWQDDRLPETVWTTNFNNIGFYNMVLQELSKHPSGNKMLNEQVKGETKVLRAWEFFILMQLYSPYHNHELGLPFNSDPDKIGSYDKRRKTQEENYNFIISELEEVLAYTSQPSPTYNIFFDKNVIHGLLAEIYLYKGDSGAKASDDYEKAIEHARALLDNGVVEYNTFMRVPSTPKNEIDVFRKDTKHSVISFVYNDFSVYASSVGFPAFGCFQYASKDLYNLFGDNDKRKQAYFRKDRTIIKLDNTEDYRVQYDFFPGAEMKLIVAESLARLGRDAEALKELKEFAAPRYTEYKLPEGKTLLESILIERRKEFCYEYIYRWLDLTRLQTGWSRDAVDKKDGSKYTIKDGDYRFCLPIPAKAELSENPIPQNPGWK